MQGVSSDKVDKIRLKNISFYGYHGNSASERNLGNQFQVDVELRVNTSKAGRTDRLKDAVDYTKVFEIVESVIVNGSFRLIERIAEEIARKVLEIDGIKDVTVNVRKLRPPVNGILDYVEIEIKRNKKR